MAIRSTTWRSVVITLMFCGCSTITGCGGCNASPSGVPVGPAAGTSTPTGNGVDTSDESKPVPVDQVPASIKDEAQARVPGFVIASATVKQGSLVLSDRYFLDGKTAKGKSLTVVVSDNGFRGFEGRITLDLVPPTVLDQARSTLAGVTLDDEVSANASTWTEGYYDLQGTGPDGKTSTVEIGESGKVYAIGHGPVPLDQVPGPVMEQAKKAHPDLTFERAWFTKHNGFFGLHIFRDYYELRGPDKKGKPRTVKVKLDDTRNVKLPLSGSVR